MNLALVASRDDEPYIAALKPFLTGHKVSVYLNNPEYVSQVCQKVDGILCSSERFLNKAVIKSREVKLSDYAGSLIYRHDVPIVFLNPLKQLYSVSEGKFLAERYISKITKPELWDTYHPFSYEILRTEDRFKEIWKLIEENRVIAMAVDIETMKEPRLMIRISSYAFLLDDNSILCFTFPIDSPETYRWMEILNACEIPKIFQNGIYDNSWFIYYGVPCTNWLFDTMDMFHSWYSELPKTLDFVTSFCVRDSWFWKDDAKGGGFEALCEYGCRDVWATLCSWLYLVEELPDWAWRNMKIKHPLNFPCLLAGMRGWKIDEKVRSEVTSEKLEEVETPRKNLANLVGNVFFNPGSPKQVTAFLSCISSVPVTSSNEDTIKKVADQHPINELWCGWILEYREAKTLVSRYLEAELINGRFTFTLAPSGTDTGRLASRKGVFWAGNNIQNIPRGSLIKSFFIADEGYFLGEPDAEQAEARCVAYLSGDENLIATVESPRSYHGINAEKFFGVPYEQIIGPDGEKLDDDIYDLSKRVNHGANYNMAEKMLLQTMGIKNVLKAQRLLKLPSDWRPLQVTAHLLRVYSDAYPMVKGDYYDSIISRIKATRKITSPLGWTRYFFGSPDKNKLDLNSAVAHVSQNLNVHLINEAFKDLYKLEKKTGGDIKILAQIHDSLPFQYREGRLDLAIEATRLMRRPTKITDCKGKTRTMVIPSALKAEGKRWSELKKIPLPF